MDNPQKLATLFAQDEQNINTTQYVLNTTIFSRFLRRPIMFL
jgi:hypothetical protein